MKDKDPIPQDEAATRTSDTPSGDARTPRPVGLRQRLGEFEIVREIGRGGMGIVYEARQIPLNRSVALKILPPGLGLTGAAVERFEREARAAARLHHTNIVPVYAIGEEDGFHFYAMEIMEGPSLDRILRDRCVARPGASVSSLGASAGEREWIDTCTRWICEVADGLEYAHREGVIHRDIKPANLLRSRQGHLCVGDFGLARLTQEPGMTVSGLFLGTPAYMSPEQIAAGRMPLDHRTDIYSLGAVLYEMLTLSRPFPGDSREEVVARIMTKEPTAPRRLNPRIPIDLETICLKALEKDPDRRYATARDLSLDLRQYLEHGVIAARRSGPLRRVVKWIRRNPLTTTAAVAMIVVSAAAGTAWNASLGRSMEAAQRSLADAQVSLGRGEDREALRRVEAALARQPDLRDARLLRARILINLRRGREAVSEAEEILKKDPHEWTAHLVMAAAARAGDLAAFGTSVEDHIKAVEKDAPRTAEAYYLRSLMAGSGGEAVGLLDRALELDPGYPEALEARIDRLTSLYRYDAALADCDRLIAARPKSSAARRRRAYLDLVLNDFGRAFAEIEQAIKLDPEDALNYDLRAAVYLNLGRASEALAEETKAIELDREDWSLLNERGLILGVVGRRREAIDELNRALALNPNGLDAYVNLLRVHRSLEDADGAAAVIDRLRIQSSGWTDAEARARAHGVIADHLLKTGRLDEAAREIDEAIQSNPGDWSLLATRASIREQQKDLGGFGADCDRLANMSLIEPADLKARAGAIARVCHRHDVALADLTKAIASAPTWADAYMARGGAYAESGRLEEAITDLTRAIDLAPKWWKPRSTRAQCYLGNGKYELALTDFDQAGAMAPDNENIEYGRGWTLLWMGRIDEAIAAIRKGIEMQPSQTTGYDSLAAILMLAGRPDEALKAINQEIEVQPSLGDAYFVRATILAWQGNRCTEAEADFRRGRARGADEPDALLDASAAHTLGFFYSCPALYDARAALESASRAAALQPGDPWITLAYALALHRSGHDRLSLRALDQGQPLRNPWYEGFRSFIAALAKLGLGQRREARADYDRGAALMARSAAPDPRLVRLRGETATLLGLKAGTPRPGP
jgi:tetratricopeptide (TPR) repeat protein